MFDSFTYYIDRKKIVGFFSTNGYNVITFRMFLIENLGYKNGKEIEEKTGATVVDDNRCIGCGLCTTRCEFDAIHLTRDVPEASTMYRSEDKLKAVGPYAAKRAGKILIKKLLK